MSESFIVVCLSEILRAGSRDDPLRTHLEKVYSTVFIAAIKTGVHFKLILGSLPDPKSIMIC